MASISGFFDGVSNVFDRTTDLFSSVARPVVEVLGFQAQRDMASAQRDATRAQADFYASQAALINSQAANNSITTAPTSTAPAIDFWRMPGTAPRTNTAPSNPVKTVVIGGGAPSGGGSADILGIAPKNIGLILLGVGAFLLIKKKGLL